MEQQPSREIPFDRPDQLEQVRAGLLQGETIIAVYDARGAGTGFLGLTSHRVVLQDKSFVGGKTALTSLPYCRITSVSMVSNKSVLGSFFASGALALTAGPTTWQIEFRGADTSRHAHDVILWFIAMNER